MKSELWSLLRGAKLQLNKRCEKCGASKEIEVHHKVYRYPIEEGRIDDLQTLCHCCHMGEHQKNWEYNPSHTVKSEIELQRMYEDAIKSDGSKNGYATCVLERPYKNKSVTKPVVVTQKSKANKSGHAFRSKIERMRRLRAIGAGREALFVFSADSD